MARVHTAKAAKDYPAHGIAKGDTYYWWQLYKQPKQMSKTRPRQSQLTGSDKMSRLYAAQEALDDGLPNSVSPEDVIALIDETISEAEDVAEEYRDVGNAEPRPPSADECEEKADEIDNWVSALEDRKSQVESFEWSDALGTSEFDSKDFDDLTEEQQAEVMAGIVEIASDHEFPF